jgi:hypothetical protein
MYRTKGDTPSHAGSLLPPATTRRFPERPPQTSREARIAPPFVPGGDPSAPPPSLETEASEPESIRAESQPAEAAEEIAEPPVEEVTAAEPPPVDEGSLLPWESTIDDQGIVEPAFLAETDAVFASLTEAVPAERDEFPLDAFIVPEDSHHIPTGMPKPDAPPANQAEPTASLAERLEDLSRRLKSEDTDSIVRRLAAGDRLDSMLAGLLAGYLAGKSEQS